VKRSIVLAAALLAFAISGVARADDRPSIGLTLNASIGTHEEKSGREQVPLLPIPLLDLRVPVKHFEFEVEGVPAIGPIGYNSGISAATRTTKISYVFGTLRYHIPNTRWSAGLGGILYNQETVTSQTTIVPCLSPCTATPFTVTEYDRSRVGGMRYEIAYAVPLSEARSLSIQIGLVPVMHAAIHESVSPFNRTLDEPERASQVDGQLRYMLYTRAATWSYGVRYINYLAHFEQNGALSDRNTLIMPFAGVSFPLGR